MQIHGTIKINCSVSLDNKVRPWAEGKCQMAGKPTRSAGSIHRCDKTPWANAQVTPHSVGANATLTNPWDDAAFINIYPKRKRHGIIRRAFVHTALKRGKESFSEMKLLFNSE